MSIRFERVFVCDSCKVQSQQQGTAFEIIGPAYWWVLADGPVGPTQEFCCEECAKAMLEDVEFKLAAQYDTRGKRESFKLVRETALCG